MNIFIKHWSQSFHIFIYLATLILSFYYGLGKFISTNHYFARFNEKPQNKSCNFLNCIAPNLPEQKLAKMFVSKIRTRSVVVWFCYLFSMKKEESIVLSLEKGNPSSKIGKLGALQDATKPYTSLLLRTYSTTTLSHSVLDIQWL